LFENRTLRRIIGPKREDIIECWRKLHNEELQKLYISEGISRVKKSRWKEYKGVSKRFRTGRLERELQMVQLSATRYNCIAIL